MPVNILNLPGLAVVDCQSPTYLPYRPKYTPYTKQLFNGCTDPHIYNWKNTPNRLNGPIQDRCA